MQNNNVLKVMSVTYHKKIGAFCLLHNHISLRTMAGKLLQWNLLENSHDTNTKKISQNEPLYSGNLILRGKKITGPKCPL